MNLMKVIDKFPDLPQESKQHLKFIRMAYGKDAVFKIEDGNLYTLSATAKNMDPAIFCHSNFNPCLVDVIHEIWHLYIRAHFEIEMYDISEHLGNEMLAYSLDRDRFEETFQNTYSTMEHYFFLSKMSHKHKDTYAFIISDLEYISQYKMVDNSVSEQQLLAFCTSQLCILKEGTNLGGCQLSHLQNICETGFNKGIQLFEQMKEFKEINNEPRVMASLIKIMWSLEREPKYKRVKNKIEFY